MLDLMTSRAMQAAGSKRSQEPRGVKPVWEAQHTSRRRSERHDTNLAFAVATRTGTSIAPGHGLNVQRTCACGGPDGRCAECGAARGELQRSSSGDAAGEAPPIVHKVLRAPGAPLDAGTRSLMEGRLGTDLSQVHIHTDEQAAASARAVNALAYTVGSSIVFDHGRYAPHRSDGRRLLAHELVHTIQQGGGRPASGQRLSVDSADSAAETEAVEIAAAPSRAVLRSPVAPARLAVARQSATRSPTVEWVAQAVHAAMASWWGTDEEGVYQALQRLGRQQGLIDQLLIAYPQMFGGASLIDELRDELSGGELEYALQLLNQGSARAAQAITARPTTADEFQLAAQRIRTAVEGPGTDEEAIFSVLLPFRQRIAQLEDAYFKDYQEDLRARIEEELSDTELAYARDLMQTPYETYLREANDKLRDLKFGVTTGEFCDVPERETFYDTESWEEHNEGDIRCHLRLRGGKQPSTAVLALIANPGRWKVDCFEFVQVAHWYARIKSQGAKRFDAEVERPFTLHPKRAAGGVRSRRTFQRDEGNALMTVHESAPGGQAKATPQKVSVEDALRQAPVGSRVMWTNPLVQDALDPDIRAYYHENTMKLSQNRFGAFPLETWSFPWIFGPRYDMSREEIEIDLAENAARDLPMSAEEIRPHIFIEEIEEYESPAPVSA